MSEPHTTENREGNAPPVAAKEVSKPGRSDFRLEYIVAPLAGLAFGCITTFNRVSQEFYDKIKNQYGVRELRTIRNAARDLFKSVNITNDLEGRLKAFEKTADFTKLKIEKDGGPLHQQAEALVANAREGMAKLRGSVADNTYDNKLLRGVGTEMEHTYIQGERNLLKAWKFNPQTTLKGIWEHWDELGHDKKVSIGSMAFISAAMAFGSMFLVGQNVRLRRELRDIHTQLDEDDPSLNTTAASHGPNVANDNTPTMQVQKDGRIHDGHAVSVDHERSVVRA